MSIQISLSLFLISLIYFYECQFVAGNITQDSHPAKHPEVYRAKSQIDSLFYKLQLDLETFIEKESLAVGMQKDARKLAKVVREELALLKPIRYLLDALAKGRASNIHQNNSCVAETGGRRMRVRIETKGSSLPNNYTISISVNHRELIDRGLTRETGEDLQVYYQTQGDHPSQVDRVISGLGTTNATVQFRLQAPIKANTVDDFTYSLVLGSAVSGSAMDNPEKVFVFHDDFSNKLLKKDWIKNWGEWKVQNGRLFGKTTTTKTGDRIEIGLYLKSGFQWKDVEVELDMMETGTARSSPGPFLRVSNVNPAHTTAWWFQCYSQSSFVDFTMRPLVNNKDGGWKYFGKIPTAFKLNTWFNFKYQLKGDRFSNWVNGKLDKNNVQVSKDWMIPAGTLGLGCHNVPSNCQTFYDNIKVRLLVSNPPKISLRNIDPMFVNHSTVLGTKSLAADSCKQIHDASLMNNSPRAKNGPYWIKTDLQGNIAVQTYCDMRNGGWTLVGKISGGVGAIYKRWLVTNSNTMALQSPNISTKNEFACLDARSLAVEHASAVLLSSADRADGLGSKWLKWRLPENREKDRFWNHAVGHSTVNAAVQTPVMVYAWNGGKKIRIEQTGVEDLRCCCSCQ